MTETTSAVPYMIKPANRMQLDPRDELQRLSDDVGTVPLARLQPAMVDPPHDPLSPLILSQAISGSIAQPTTGTSTGCYRWTASVTLAAVVQTRVLGRSAKTPQQ